MAGELLKRVRKIFELTSLDNIVEHDLERYVQFKNATEGTRIKKENVDLEEFLGFLDLEHFLWLKGGDTFSSEGNKSQLIIKQVLSRLLYNNTPQKENIPKVYKNFVKKLNPSDWILTFNYDTLLERTLEAEGIPFRLFPQRYSKVSPMFSTVDSSKDDEVIVIKLHGSVDWFDNSSYLEEVELSKKNYVPWEVRHPVFAASSGIDYKPIVDGLRPDDDPLKSVFRVSDPASILDADDWLHPPMILTPSSQKMLYMKALRAFWHGMQNGPGSYHLLAFIGYSLPAYDFYARQAFYFMAGNYQNTESKYFRNKRNLRILNFCENPSGLQKLRKQFQFLNWKKTEIWKKGFSEEAVKWLFS